MYCYQVANSSPPSPLSLLSPQIAAKMGGDQMSHMNNSSPILDPSLYGYGGQKRSMDDGGKPAVAVHLSTLPHAPYKTILSF